MGIDKKIYKELRRQKIAKYLMSQVDLYKQRSNSMALSYDWEPTDIIPTDNEKKRPYKQTNVYEKGDYILSIRYDLYDFVWRIYREVDGKEKMIVLGVVTYGGTETEFQTYLQRTKFD